MSIVFQVFGEMLGEENMSGISTIHHALCHVDSSAS
jgi:hypothetical protein